MAKTLGQVMRGVAKANNSSLSANEEHQIYTLTISYDDGRSQVVQAYNQTDVNDQSWLIVSSAFGKVAELDAGELLRRNEAYADLAFIGQESDGTAAVFARIPFETSTEDLVVRMVHSVAAYADLLEEEFYGDDDH
jgi:hypothetical protein